MNWDNAPELKINIYDKENDVYASIICPEKDDTCYVLQIYKGTKEKRRNDYKALLYHEFTHIYDCTTIKPVILKSANVFSWYTEAHAVVVSLMYLCGFENVEATKKVDITDNVNYRNKKISLDDYFKKTFNNISQRIENEDFEIGKSIQYYFGCLRFYKDFCLFDSSYYIELLKANYFNELFGSYVITKIAGIIASNDYSPKALVNMKKHERSFLKILVLNERY